MEDDTFRLKVYTWMWCVPNTIFIFLQQLRGGYVNFGLFVE